MFYDHQIWVGQSEAGNLSILPKMANRHGIIAGATGTGKTITLKVLAESFSDAGVPVFLADVKGDLAGMCRPGADSADMRERFARFGLDGAGFRYRQYPVCFWDIYGEKGLPLRTTVSEMGPTLLSRLMDLTDAQADVLSVVFRIADEEGLLLLDTKDLKSMLSYVAENSGEYGAVYGNLPRQSINSILRGVTALEGQGGDRFFGEPALDIRDWFRTDFDGRGVINILDSESLINSPMTYSAFLLWMLSELFETLPEAGDLERPRMVFFFDEARLLFADAPKALVQKLEQVVKLIRSKGVGVYFITQSPRDIPDGVLGQLGNKIQHALHAYTPADQKALNAAADSFRPNPEFDTRQALSELGIGEALVSFLQEDGSPAVVQRAKILPPQSLMGPIGDGDRRSEIQNNALYAKYGTCVDRDSAYEFLQRRAIQLRQETEERKQAEERARAEAQAEKEAAREAERAEKARERAIAGVARSALGTVGREVGSSLGRQFGSFGKKLGGNLGGSIGRGLLGTLFGR